MGSPLVIYLNKYINKEQRVDGLAMFGRETNLKCRQALPDTSELGQDEVMLGRFDGEIVCEPPNNNLNKFEGTLSWNNQK